MLTQICLIESFFKTFSICIPAVSAVRAAEMGVRPHQPSMFISHKISVSHVVIAFQLGCSHEIKNIGITKGELN